MGLFRRLREKNEKLPLLTDNSLNQAFAVKYFLYGCFGIAGVVYAVPSFASVAGETSAVILAASVALAAFTASVCAWNNMVSTRWPKIEFYATCVLILFIALYSVSLIWLATTTDSSRASAAIISLALIVMPRWRLRYLYRDGRI